MAIAITIQVLGGVGLAIALAGRALAGPPYAPSQMARPQPTSPPLILAPRPGAVAPIGRLWVQIGGPLGAATEGEVEMVRHTPGTLDQSITWQAPARDLEAGLLLPSDASASEIGDFSLRVRIVAPYTGPQSDPVAVRLTPRRGQSADRDYGRDRLPPPPPHAPPP